MKLEGEIKCEGFEEWTQGEVESLGAFSLLMTAGGPAGTEGLPRVFYGAKGAGEASAQSWTVHRLSRH